MIGFIYLALAPSLALVGSPMSVLNVSSECYSQLGLLSENSGLETIILFSGARHVDFRVEFWPRW